MIKKLINEFIDVCVIECQNETNRKKIEDSVLSPTIDFIIDKIKPYIIGTTVFLITMIILIMSIIFLIIFK